MRKCIAVFWREESGQDLVEYTLLIALFVFLVFGLAGTGQAPIRAIWDKVNSNLSSGVTSAAGGA
jgi:Flp pilus assembly pilin Flp